MKKILTILISAFTMLSCSQFSENFDGSIKEKKKKSISEDGENDGENLRTLFTECGGFFFPSQPYTTINSYYQYPAQNLNIGSLLIGEDFSITFHVYDIPNRYTIKSGGNTIYTTGWIGTANYPGPWGQSINTFNSLNVNLTKNYSTTYEVIVETQTPPNYSYSPNQDNWEVWVTCPKEDEPIPGPGPTPICECCGDWVEGNHDEYAEYKTYDVIIDTSCLTNGDSFSFYVQSHEIPNRFQVFENGVSISDSGWLGQANFSGPWGASINNISDTSMPLVTFNSGSTYEMKVETKTAPDATYYPAFDYWYAQMSCISGGGGIQ
ncbi:hypothetical protein SAMN04488104_103019 [Algoriphagus faecimaris]|uniref:Uncharacterized protein n=1 Tax=Algoriphagus faecimaris TaxID=686796 RepID=A0A1G6USL6_9BACT|nr:hypothetical protein [Algoriphagus faecimaris]SDD44299.1 hypothetical protein SAMN04488104_103019 [Algoriphagus faecimaris]